MNLFKPLFIFIVLSFIFLGDKIFASEPLKEDFLYKVEYSGIDVGEIRLKYLDLSIELNSNVNILKLFQIKSNEKTYVDKKTYLPLKVERDVKFLGRRVNITEIYDQRNGSVSIIKKTKDKTIERKILQQTPIQSIISLFFFYYKREKDFKIGEILDFNLPLRKISVKIRELRRIEDETGIEEFYLLEVSPVKFLIWIRKKDNLAQRIEFPVFLGKITISLITR